MADTPNEDPPKPKKMGRPFRPGGHIKPRLSLRSGDKWFEWFAELADEAGLDKSKLIDAALADFAARRRFRQPPNRSE